MPEIRSLTGLRGIAALLVVVFHLVNVLDPTMANAPHWHSKFYLSVDLFFVLSGFVVTLNYHVVFTSALSAQNFVVFMIRRLARIYPLYFMVFLCFSILRVAEVYLTGSTSAVPLTWQVFLTNVLMIQTWGFGPSITAASWSISTEMFAYLLFPFLVVPVVRSGKGVLAVLGLGAALLLTGIAVAAWELRVTRTFGLDVIHPDYGFPLLRCVAGFVIGMLVYRAYASGLARHWLGNDRTGSLICFGLSAGLLLGLPDLLLYPLFPSIVLVLSVNQGRLARLFGHPVLHRLGLWSYALYLLHGALQRILIVLHAQLSDLVPATAAWMIAAAVHLAIVLMLSALCFIFIEVPGRRAVMQGWARMGETAQTARVLSARLFSVGRM